MKKIAVVHYLPLELYPPVINFLNILSTKELKIKAFSTENHKNRKKFTNKKLVGVYRAALPKLTDSSYIRLLKYLEFNISCFLGLVKYNPDEIIYFESYSAGPVYWYLRLLGKGKKLKIHYHEYTSPEWYQKGMRIVKTYHRYEENFLYQKAEWISHTNQERINLFIKDHSRIDYKKMHVIPNYPPMSWTRNNYVNKPKLNNQRDHLRTVYVGSLSLEATYLEKYCEWIDQQEGKVTFDIYSYNLHKDTIQFLDNLRSPFIRFFNGGVEYFKIPTVLDDYDVGIIFYKDYSANVRHCAPNKLFEYIVCGLEVWFSDKMQGCFPYKSSESPRILAVDFSNLNNELLFTAKAGKNASVNTNISRYTAEQAMEPLTKLLDKQ